MAHVTDRDYAKLADAVAEDLVTNKVPLNDSIAKLASDMGLTDEQVCRLCEATNNTTFSKLFKAREKTAGDRLIEFDVADSKKVLGKLIKQAEPVGTEKTAAYLDLAELPDEMHNVRHPEMVPPAMEKVAAFSLRPEPRINKTAERAKLAKAKDHLAHAKLAAEMLYVDRLASLRGEFRKLYDGIPFDRFEKQAAARWGADAIPVLNELRQQMRMPEANYNIEVLTKTAGMVDDRHPTMQLFSSVLDARREITRLGLGIKKLENAL
jgi:AraC-like DNA-binding protein